MLITQSSNTKKEFWNNNHTCFNTFHSLLCCVCSLGFFFRGATLYDILLDCTKGKKSFEMELNEDWRQSLSREVNNKHEIVVDCVDSLPFCRIRRSKKLHFRLATTCKRGGRRNVMMFDHSILSSLVNKCVVLFLSFCAKRREIYANFWIVNHHKILHLYAFTSLSLSLSCWFLFSNFCSAQSTR